MRKYYMLYIFEDTSWGPQFGDYSKDIVKEESRNSYSTVPGKYKKIVTLSNGRGKTIREMTMQLNCQLECAA